MSEAALKALGLVKTYHNGREEAKVLKGVDLRVDKGELVAIVGPSGAGKTTLLYLLGGLARPDAGSVEVGGVLLTGLDDRTLSRHRNQRMGFVFQSHHLLPELSALENVALTLRVGGKTEAVAALGAKQLLQEVGLGMRLNHKPGELSGGEQQRVALARALVSGPDLLLADEPTGNLDRGNAESVFELLKESARGRAQAVVMVTHNEALAAQADRIVRMQDGAII
ncbi:MAG: ABC transporter ATP-binding protein [candidate division FCPU426 bacterium]